jgi:hypothetical protein
MADLDNLVGKPVADVTIDPSGEGKNEKLMQPNAKEDPEAVSGDNPQKAWIGGRGKPSGPYGQQGKNF